MHLTAIPLNAFLTTQGREGRLVLNRSAQLITCKLKHWWWIPRVGLKSIFQVPLSLRKRLLSPLSHERHFIMTNCMGYSTKESKQEKINCHWRWESCLLNSTLQICRGIAAWTNALGYLRGLKSQSWSHSEPIYHPRLLKPGTGPDWEIQERHFTGVR